MDACAWCRRRECRRRARAGGLGSYRLLLVWTMSRSDFPSGGSTGPVVQNVSELVRQESLTGRTVRRVLRASENDVTADGVCPRAQGLGGIGGFSIRVHSDVAQRPPEAFLEPMARGGLERLPAALEYAPKQRRALVGTPGNAQTKAYLRFLLKSGLLPAPRAAAAAGARRGHR
jgi:hypothetical protein